MVPLATMMMTMQHGVERIASPTSAELDTTVHSPLSGPPLANVYTPP